MLLIFDKIQWVFLGFVIRMLVLESPASMFTAGFHQSIF